MTTKPLLLFTLVAGSAVASSYSFAGSFAHDDDRQYFFLTAGTASIIVQTWSFAGGINAEGAAIPGGGFSPVISLFSAIGSQDLLAVDSGGVSPAGCGLRNIDPTTSFCLDGFLSGEFSPGDYVLVLTEADNLPNGGTLADGFAQDRQGDFTGVQAGIPGEAFLLNAGAIYQRSNAWEVDIVGADAAAESPEPSTMWTSGLLLVAVVCFSLKLNRSSRSYDAQNRLNCTTAAASGGADCCYR